MDSDYISNIIERVTNIRYFLGEELFSVTDRAGEAYSQHDVDLSNVIKEMSSLSSDIVALVFEAKGQKENLSDADLAVINKVGLLATKLGTAEGALYKIKKQITVVKDETLKLTTSGMDFAQTLLGLQDYSRSIITEFRQAGHQVPGSDLQKLMSVE